MERYRKRFKENGKIYKINSERDIKKIQKIYGNDTYFKVLETDEEITLPDLLFGYDNQKLTLRVL